jgi:hypothetical protein
MKFRVEGLDADRLFRGLTSLVEQAVSYVEAKTVESRASGEEFSARALWLNADRRRLEREFQIPPDRTSNSTSRGGWISPQPAPSPKRLKATSPSQEGEATPFNPPRGLENLTLHVVDSESGQGSQA